MLRGGVKLRIPIRIMHTRAVAKSTWRAKMKSPRYLVCLALRFGTALLGIATIVIGTFPFVSREGKALLDGASIVEERRVRVDYEGTATQAEERSESVEYRLSIVDHTGRTVGRALSKRGPDSRSGGKIRYMPLVPSWFVFERDYVPSQFFWGAGLLLGASLVSCLFSRRVARTKKPEPCQLPLPSRADVTATAGASVAPPSGAGHC
jgi:hypothetical protein